MKKYVVTIFVLLTFVSVVEFSVVMPLAPQIAETFGVLPTKVTILFIGYTLMGLLTPFFGYVADKYGIKKILLLNVMFFTIGSLVISLVSTSLGYFLGRSIIGLGYFSITSLVIVYTSKIISYERLGFISGLYKFAFAGGMFASPIIGSFFVLNYDIQKLYLTIGLFGFLLFLLLLPIPKVISDGDIDLKDLKKLVLNKDVQLMMITTFMLAVPSVFFFNYFSVHLQSIGYSVSEASTMFSIVASGSIIAAIIIVLFSDKIGKLRMTKFGIYLSTFAILGFLIDNNVVLIITAVLFGVGYDTVWGLFFPVATKMFTKGANSFITILSMAMSIAGVCTNSLAPIVNSRWGFNANLIVAFSAFIICMITFNYVIKPYKNKLN